MECDSIYAAIETFGSNKEMFRLTSPKEQLQPAEGAKLAGPFVRVQNSGNARGLATSKMAPMAFCALEMK
jgi:hypothetical protein